MAFYYTYVPRYDPEPPKAPAPKPTNPWVASPPTPTNAWMLSTPSPGVAAPAPAASSPGMYYATAEIPEPVKQNFWYGQTRAEVEAKKPKPVQLVQEVPTPPGPQYWCRELDGSYTLRSANEIHQKLQPGFWTFAHPGGYPYWVRTKTS